MPSCKIFVLILVLVGLAGAASIEESPDEADKDDTAVEVLPIDKSSPAGQPVEVSTTKGDEAPVAAAAEPPGNPNWWQKTKAWLKKHKEAAKQWVAKTFKKKSEESAGTSTPAPDVPGAEKMEEPAGNPGWWQKTKNWFSGIFGSKKEGEKEPKVEEAIKS